MSKQSSFDLHCKIGSRYILYCEDGFSVSEFLNYAKKITRAFPDRLVHVGHRYADAINSLGTRTVKAPILPPEHFNKAHAETLEARRTRIYMDQFKDALMDQFANDEVFVPRTRRPKKNPKSKQAETMSQTMSVT